REIERGRERWKELTGQTPPRESSPQEQIGIRRSVERAYNAVKDEKRLDAADKASDKRLQARDEGTNAYVRRQLANIKTYEDGFDRKKTSLESRIARAEEKGNSRLVKNLQKELEAAKDFCKRKVDGIKKEMAGHLEHANFVSSEKRDGISAMQHRLSRINASPDRRSGESDLDRILKAAMRDQPDSQHNPIVREELIKGVVSAYIRERALEGDLPERAKLVNPIMERSAQQFADAERLSEEAHAKMRKIMDSQGNHPLAARWKAEAIEAQLASERARSESANLGRAAHELSNHKSVSIDEAVAAVTDWVIDQGVVIDIGALANKEFDMVLREQLLDQIRTHAPHGLTDVQIASWSAAFEKNLGVEIDEVELRHVLNDERASNAADNSPRFIANLMRMGISSADAAALARKRFAGEITDPKVYHDTVESIKREAATREQRKLAMTNTARRRSAA
ncbi:MAG: hypothetical protein KDD53_05930, partial [Bdellovibrionales bacterium]|nr:hypothetical protein [Bdellovibrionales bacterium]